MYLTSPIIMTGRDVGDVRKVVGHFCRAYDEVWADLPFRTYGVCVYQVEEAFSYGFCLSVGLAPPP